MAHGWGNDRKSSLLLRASGANNSPRDRGWPEGCSKQRGRRVEGRPQVSTKTRSKSSLKTSESSSARSQGRRSRVCRPAFSIPLGSTTAAPPVDLGIIPTGADAGNDCGSSFCREGCAPAMLPAFWSSVAHASALVVVTRSGIGPIHLNRESHRAWHKTWQSGNTCLSSARDPSCRVFEALV